MVALIAAIRVLWQICRQKARPQAPDRLSLPAHVYRQPDPLIYDQYYLASLGLAVTWQNPDIHLELPSAPGVPVDSHDLKPSTTYVVVARIWNGSTSAPVVDLPVEFSYLAFGIGTVKNHIGKTAVDLPVKGVAGCPAFARLPWTTPVTPGHYCLQVELIWPDDANPKNNLGQHNTDVRHLNSPRATFTFPLRNDGSVARAFHMEADAYRIPPLPRCDERTDQDRQRPLDRHDPALYPVPPGWKVTIDPRETRLGPGEEHLVTVDITAPDGFAGLQTFNVNTFSNATLMGGVTLHTEG